MFDIFTEEIEVLIKEGIANLYWYKGDLRKAWGRAGVSSPIIQELFLLRNADGAQLTKRQLMDALYEKVRLLEFNRKLEVSRNFVRFLVEHESFRKQDDKHNIDKAAHCALRLKQILDEQKKEIEKRSFVPRTGPIAAADSYDTSLARLNQSFCASMKLAPQPRGYELQTIFAELMKASKIPVHQPFRIVGEQIDGAIEFKGHHYLVELKWVADKVAQGDLSSHYLKVQGKFESRGIFLAMNGYSDEVLESLPKGKSLLMLLLDGMHLANVLSGMYTFQELLDSAISHASLRGEIYCPHKLTRY